MAHRRLRASLPPLHDQPLNAPPELMRAAAEKNVPGGLMRDIRAIRSSAAPTSAMGGVLAGAASVAATAARSVLGRASSAQPQGDPLGSGAVRAGRLSVAGAGQRMAVASGVVRTHRAG